MKAAQQSIWAILECRALGATLQCVRRAVRKKPPRAAARRRKIVRAQQFKEQSGTLRTLSKKEMPNWLYQNFNGGIQSPT
jgi:hypothetical protein